MGGLPPLAEPASVPANNTHAKLITDAGGQKVGPDQITEAVHEICSGAGVDQLIVYFAGHGINLQHGDRWLLTELEREGYEGTYGAGTSLARAGLPAKEAADLDKAPEQLRSAFAMLLGEHMELIVDAQRATFAGSPEFEAAAAQVNANTATLAKAMGGIVGPEKAAEFQRAWANHVEGLMAYTSAVAGKDEAAKTVAKENLDGFAERLALYFSDVVRNVLTTDPLTEAITAHDTHLIAQVDAYAAKDYAKAQQVQDEGYQQMVGVANVLVDAIEKVMAAAMPAGGSKTGGGGMAGHHH